MKEVVCEISSERSVEFCKMSVDMEAYQMGEIVCPKA